MTGVPNIINGICICYARLALSDNGNKWDLGTVLELYPLDHKFNWGDMARFLIIRVRLTEEQVELVEMRKLEIAPVSFLSIASEKKYKANRTTPRMKESEFETRGEKPRLDVLVDGVSLGAVTPEKFWKKEPEPMITEDDEWQPKPTR